MKINHRLELEPVLYNNLPIKLLEISATPNNTCFELHWHTRFEILVIDQGQLELTLNGQKFSAQTGDILLINPETMHEGHTDNNSVRYRVIMFEYDSFTQNKVARNLLTPFHLGQLGFQSKIHDDEIVNLSQELFLLAQHRPNGFELKIIGLMYYLLGILLSKYIDETGTVTLCPNDFQEIIHYISNNYCKDISTASISSKFGYNESYFCRRFKDITGLKPLKYIKILRLEKAKHLLKSSERSIISIATECGFSDANYFARCFKAHYKITPKEYQTKNA